MPVSMSNEEKEPKESGAGAETAEEPKAEKAPENTEEARVAEKEEPTPDAEKDGGEEEKAPHGKSKKEAKREEKKLKEENEALRTSLSELNDKYARMLAEYDNFRKRAQKERDGVYSDACTDVLKEVLTVKDSLEMAMKFADDSEFSRGVTMTLTKFGEILKKLGVEEFGAAGDAFDPNLHNAILHAEDESRGENEVAEVLMKGYRRGEKIIRYAMVKVAN